MSSSSEVDERTLREIYFPAFETAVKRHSRAPLCVPIIKSMVLLRPRTNGFLQMCFVENGDLRVMLCQTGELLMTV